MQVRVQGTAVARRVQETVQVQWYQYGVLVGQVQCDAAALAYNEPRILRLLL